MAMRWASSGRSSCGLVLLLLMIRGDAKALIPMAGIAVLLQAWQSGLLQ